MQKISLNEIERTFKERSWWALLFNLYPAKYITYYLANKTNITPNVVTTISLLFAIFAGLSFLFDHFFIGAILYQISFIFDIVDGALARSKNLTSSIGAFYDVVTDWIKAPILMIILFYKLDQILLGMAVMFLLFLNCCINRYNDMLFYTQKKSLTKTNNIKKSLIGRYFEFMKRKHLIALPGSVEIEGLLLFFFPIFKSVLFVYLAILLLVFNFFLKTYVVIKKIK